MKAEGFGKEGAANPPIKELLKESSVTIVRGSTFMEMNGGLCCLRGERTSYPFLGCTPEIATFI